MKKTFKIISLIISFTIIMMLSSCFFNSVNDNDKELNVKEVDFTNLSNDYTVEDKKINLYFYKDGNVPLIDIRDYYNALSGFYDMSSRDVSINKLFNRLYISSKKYSQQRVIFDWKYNTITFKNTLSVYSTVSSSSTDFSSYYDMKLISGISSLDIEYYLDNYNIDILYKDEKVLIPMSVLNLIGGNYYNVIYNTKKLYGYYYGDDMTDVYDSSLVNSTTPADIASESKNELLFLLNEKYGLKEYSNVSNYNTRISAKDMLALNSNNTEDRLETYINIVNKLLDDPHSRMMSSSIYSANRDKLSQRKYHDPTERTIKISDIFKELTEKYTSSELYNNLFYYKNDTLFISFDDFLVGKKNEVYQSDGVYNENAYLIDTAALFYKALNDCKNNHSEVKNVVIDISRNGGGYIAAMYRALTFLSDNDVLSGYRVTNDAIEVYNIIGDPNMDGNYEDDAFKDYNYYILESEGTFSAANAFVCFAKYSKVAKTIGKRSGGGMCAVMPYVLCDGTQFTLSDSSQQVAIEKIDNKYYWKEIESGAPVDIELDYDNFYNLDKIIELIHNDQQSV